MGEQRRQAGLVEVVAAGQNEVPVGHVEQRREGIEPQARVGARRGHEGGVEHHEDQQQQQGGQQAPGPPGPELPERDGVPALPLRDQQRGDEEAREDEERVHPEEARRQPRDAPVVGHHPEDGEGTHAVERRDVGEIRLLARRVGVRRRRCRRGRELGRRRQSVDGSGRRRRADHGDIVAAAAAEGLPGRPYAKLFAMRRALPWVTVGLLVVGVGVGAGLGIAGQTPAPPALTATSADCGHRGRHAPGRDGPVQLFGQQRQPEPTTAPIRPGQRRNRLRGRHHVHRRAGPEHRLLRDECHHHEGGVAGHRDGPGVDRSHRVHPVQTGDPPGSGRPVDEGGHLAQGLVRPSGGAGADRPSRRVGARRVGARASRRGRRLRHGARHGGDPVPARRATVRDIAALRTASPNRWRPSSSGSTVRIDWCRPGCRPPRTSRRRRIWGTWPRDKVFSPAASPPSAPSTSAISAPVPPSPHPGCSTPMARRVRIRHDLPGALPLSGPQRRREVPRLTVENPGVEESGEGR